MNDLLTVSHLSRTYHAENGEVRALEDLSFSVAPGEFLGIVGPSGCGKSTLLSLIAGLDQPSGGDILLDGAPLGQQSLKVGYMLQQDELLPWRSIWNNVLFGLELQKNRTDEMKAYAKKLLTSYGLWEFRDKYPDQLSGGMRQRAALCRTLAVRPRVLLLDEAFSALDYQTRLRVTQDVSRILRKEQMTTLMVSHDIAECISMSDRILLLTPRPGRLRTIHTPDFGGEDLTPLQRREHPAFQKSFQYLWKELNQDEPIA